MRVTDRVEKILQHDAKSRDSDHRLILIYMMKSGIELTPAQQDKFMNLPAFETITRIRRQLQEEGKYPASPKVEEARYQKFKQVKNNIASESAEEALARLGYRIVED